MCVSVCVRAAVRWGGGGRVVREEVRGEEEGDTRKTRRIPQKRKDVKKDGGTMETRGERLVKHSKYICFGRCVHGAEACLRQKDRQASARH